LIITASRAYSQAPVTSEPRLEDLLDLYALRIRGVVSTARTVECADRILAKIVSAFFALTGTA
jgi:hypothetical protein